MTHLRVTTRARETLAAKSLASLLKDGNRTKNGRSMGTDSFGFRFPAEKSAPKHVCPLCRKIHANGRYLRPILNHQATLLSVFQLSAFAACFLPGRERTKSESYLEKVSKAPAIVVAQAPVLACPPRAPLVQA